MLYLFVLIGLVSVGCKPKPKPESIVAASPSDIISSDPDLGPAFDELIENRFQALCMAVDSSCRERPIIKVACDMGKPTLTAAIDAIMDESPLPQLKRHLSAEATDEFAKIQIEIENQLALDFIAALNDGKREISEKAIKLSFDVCLNREKYEMEYKFDREAQTAEFQKKAREGARELWTNIVIAAGAIFLEAAVEKGMSYIGSIAGKWKASPGVALSWAKLFGLMACDVAGAVAAAMIKDDGVDWNANQCQIGEYFTARTARACAVTGSIACSSALGFVDIRNLGIRSDNDVANFAISITNAGLSGACMLGGGLSRISCGVINQSVMQIKKAWTTGTNDIAECAPVAQAARCFGQWLTVGLKPNNQGVEVARFEKSSNGETWPVRACCYCRKEYYHKFSGVIRSKHVPYRTRAFLGVIQKANGWTDNCMEKEGRKPKVYMPSKPKLSGWTYQYSYHTYEDCGRIDIVDPRCAIEIEDGEGNLQDRSVAIWDREKRRSSSTILAPAMSPREFNKVESMTYRK